MRRKKIDILEMDVEERKEVIKDFAEKIKHRLPESVELHSIKLNETATSYAEWFASDNQ